MKQILVGLIHIYQKIPGPWHHHCRHIPTCSNYAIEAIEKHGAIKGCFLAIKRIISCNPFSHKDMYDPVPERKETKQMKKKKTGVKLLALFLIPLLLCGCNRDDMEDIEIVTTNYPNEYILEKLYGEHATISSIYPDGVKVDVYNITKKQKKDQAMKDLFVYTGLIERERKIAIELLDYNSDLKIIDSSYVLETTYQTDTIWLDPSFMLMMAQNVRLSLKEYIENSYLQKEIDEKYEELKVDISELDANIRLAIENAKHQTILVASEGLKFLEKYGLKVYVIHEDISDKEKAEIQALIQEKEITKLFSFEDEKLGDEAKKLLDINVNSLKEVSLKKITLLTDEERKTEEDYISLLNKNLDAIKEELYHE